MTTEIRPGQEKSDQHPTLPAQVSKAAGTLPQLIPVTRWNSHHPWPPIGGLRHLIFFAETNGFKKVIRRVGRRILIDEQAFFAWVDQQGVAK